jgi:predicted Zn-dependent protease
MDKIAALREILAMDPGNSFARYGIAMELVSQNRLEEALEEFDALLDRDPNYTAGYFMAAQTLVSAGRTQQAQKRLEDGIRSATSAGNTHAVNEMQAMLDDLNR